MRDKRKRKKINFNIIYRRAIFICSLMWMRMCFGGALTAKKNVGMKMRAQHVLCIIYSISIFSIIKLRENYALFLLVNLNRNCCKHADRFHFLNIKSSAYMNKDRHLICDVRIGKTCHRKINSWRKKANEGIMCFFFSCLQIDIFFLLCLFLHALRNARILMMKIRKRIYPEKIKLFKVIFNFCNKISLKKLRKSYFYDRC
jgi:hypothetical protein